MPEWEVKKEEKAATTTQTVLGRVEKDRARGLRSKRTGDRREGKEWRDIIGERTTTEV